MKKFVIGVFAVFLAIGIAVSTMLIGASRVSRYLRESDDHRRDVLVNATVVHAERTDIDAPATSLSPVNTLSFFDAVTRSGLLYKWFPPKNKEGIVVTFADGAEYTVVDGGEDKTGHDVVYIIYKYDGHTYYFSLTGYNSMDRIGKCVSPEGFNDSNWLLEDQAA